MYLYMKRQARRHLAQVVNQLARLFTAQGDARLKPLGFRYAQVPVLAALRDGEAITQADLARRLGVEQPSMAQLLARMERDGAIERAPHEGHGRAVRVSATPQTARRLTKAREQLSDLDAVALDGLSPQEIETLFALLERVRENLGRLDGGAK